MIERRVVSTIRVRVENRARPKVFMIDSNGSTPVHLTVEHGFRSNHDIQVEADVLQVLFEQGANLLERLHLYRCTAHYDTATALRYLL